MSDFYASSALFFFVALGAFVPVSIALCLLKRARTIAMQPVRLAARWLLAVSAALALAIMLFPVHFDMDNSVPIFNSSQLSLVPFHTLVSLFSTFSDPAVYWQAGLAVTARPVVCWLLLLLPVGFFLPQCGGIFKKLMPCAATALFFSLFIEAVRYVEAVYRLADGVNADIDTVIFNMLGFFAGYALFAALKRHILLIVLNGKPTHKERLL